MNNNKKGFLRESFLLTLCFIFLLNNKFDKENSNREISELNSQISNLQEEKDLVNEQNAKLKTELRSLAQYEVLFDELQEEYNKNDLKVMMTNNKGEISYHFVYLVNCSTDSSAKTIVSNGFFREINNSDNVYPNKSYEIYNYDLDRFVDYNSVNQIVSMSSFNYLPDSKITNALIDIDAILPYEYADKLIFSKEDILKIENIINSKKTDLDPLLTKEFSLEYLATVYDGEKAHIYDLSNPTLMLQSKYEWDIDTLQYYEYCYGITNPNLGIKINLGLNYIVGLVKSNNNEEVKFNPYISEVVSLDESEMVNQNGDFTILSLSEYLPDEWKEKKTFSYNEILELEMIINSTLNKDESISR